MDWYTLCGYLRDKAKFTYPTNELTCEGPFEPSIIEQLRGQGLVVTTGFHKGHLGEYCKCSSRGLVTISWARPSGSNA